MIRDNHAPTPVTILAGEPVVGRAIEALLASEGYEARFVACPKTGGLAGLPAPAGVLLIAPGTPRECYRPIVAPEVVGSAMPALPVLDLPVLELVGLTEADRPLEEHMVSWPCAPAELCRRIDALLAKSPLAGSVPASSGFSGAIGLAADLDDRLEAAG